MITAQSRLGHSSITAQVTAQSRLAVTILVTVSSRWAVTVANFFLMGACMYIYKILRHSSSQVYTKIAWLIRVLYHITIIIKSAVLSICHCFGLDHETMVWAVCLSIFLTHWGRVTHICVSNLTTIGSDNGLSPGRRQIIILTNARMLLIGSVETNFGEILIGIHMQSVAMNSIQIIYCRS